MTNEEVIKGVGLMLFAYIEESWKMLTVKELKDKELISKKAGMVCFPMETYKPEDGCIEETLERLIAEELEYIHRDQIEIITWSKRNFHPLSKSYVSNRNVVGHYAIAIFHGDPSQLSYHTIDPNTVFDGWRTPEELLAQPLKRQSVDMMVSDFEKNYRELLNEPKNYLKN